MFISPLIAAAIAFAFSQVLLSIVLLFKVRRQWFAQELLLVFFLVSVLAYLISPFAIGHWLAPYLKTVENTLPGLFWLLCCRLFDDRFRLAAWNCVLAGLTVLLPVVARVSATADVILPQWLFETLPQILEFVLLAWALYVVLRYWRDDLVETRRELRVWFCLLAGVYTFVLISLRELVFAGDQWFAVWQYAPIGIISFTVNILLLQFTPGVLHIYKPDTAGLETLSKPQTSAVDVPDDVVKNLQTLMSQENIYREIGLTIGQLAEKLDLPEYRLRKIINGGLGYRNFSDYLNGFRIKDASRCLADPRQIDVPILNIALDTGFRSLSSFNKVFRETHSMTPSEYRRLKTQT